MLPLRRIVLALGFIMASLGALGCGGAPTDDDETPASGAEAVTVADFVRSDQVSFGRAPTNTVELQTLVQDDFSGPERSAQEVIDWIRKNPHDDNPIYLGCIHTWIYDADATYRADVHTLVSTIHAATHHPLLVYFEEENASNPPHPVSASNGHSLRTLAESTSLLCATYAGGQDDHASVVAKVEHYKAHYHETLGVPMSALLIDVDVSQTPYSFYYGTRGDLANFDRVVPWALDAAYDQGFGGFHTYGNVGGRYGTVRAADSTYDALNKAWDDLVKAHPHQKFSGL